MQYQQSFIDFIDKFGSNNQPAMCYHHDSDPAEWQQLFMDKLNTLRGLIPPRVTPEVEIIDSEKLTDYTRQLIKVSVSEISILTAYRLIPNNIKPDEKRPALLALHGHTKYGIEAICGMKDGSDGTHEDGPEGAYALNAVQSGYIVMAPA